MTVVESVNEKSGVVVLGAENVGAVATSVLGQPGGVATLNESGALTSAQLPSSVVSSRAKTLAEVAGLVKVVLSEGSPPFTTFQYKLTGAAEFEPIEAPSYKEGLTLVIEPNGFTFSVKGVSWIGSEPAFGTTGKYAISLFVLGSTIFALAGLQGREGAAGTNGNTIRNGTTAPEESLGVNGDFYIKTEGGVAKEIFGPKAAGKWPAGTAMKGEKGANGAEGPEGFTSRRLGLPTKANVFKGTGAATTEEREAIAESMSRQIVANSLVLTSGTPVAAMIEVNAKKKCNGVLYSVTAAEGTPANRTHFWVALLNEKLEKIAQSADYTSATNTPAAAGTIRGLLFEAAYETAVQERLYAVICEVMSSSAAVTIATREGTATLSAEPPALAGALNAGQTTPGALPSPATLTGNGKNPWLAIF